MGWNAGMRTRREGMGTDSERVGGEWLYVLCPYRGVVLILFIVYLKNTLLFKGKQHFF